jgi:hypothetical protein
MKTLKLIQYTSMSILLAYTIEQVILFAFTGLFVSELNLTFIGYVMTTVYYLSFISSSILIVLSKTEALGPVKSVKDMSIDELTKEPAFKRRTPTNFGDHDGVLGI